MNGFFFLKPPNISSLYLTIGAGWDIFTVSMNLALEFILNLQVEASANPWGNRDEGVQGWYVRRQQTAVSTNSDPDEEAGRESEDIEEERLKWGA